MFWLQVINLILGYLLLFGALYLAWRAYRSGVRRTEHVVKMEKMLTEVVQANADSAHVSAESARTLAEAIHNLIALQAKEPGHE